MFYFVTFHLITNFVLISLVKGIVWEIFTVVEEATKEQKHRMELNFPKELILEQAEDEVESSKKITSRSNYGEVIASILSDENKSEIVSESPIP